MSELGVYIPCLNEEYLITPCVQAIQKVFSQVEVIDIGSKDDTLLRLEALDVKVHRYAERLDGAQYIQLKNDFSAKHEWVFWVDGDEVWPEENLRYLVDNWKENKAQYTAFKIAWRMPIVVNGQIYASSPLKNGPKLYKGADYRLKRKWPKEVLEELNLAEVELSKKQSLDFHINHQWCWHGKMLTRTPMADTPRDKKRNGYLGNFKKYHSGVTWEKLDAFPWRPIAKELYTVESPEGFLT